MDLELAGRTALVTGASRGIGRAVAEQFAREGVARLCLVARQPGPLEQCAAALRRDHGTQVDTLAVDLSASGSVAAIHERWPAVDILVNNAADSRPGALADTTDEDWRISTELKILSYVAMARRYYASMKARGGGVILNTIGIAGENWDAAYVIGSTVNAAMMAFTRALGGVSMADGIRVVGVNPGAVATERLVRLSKRRAADQFGDETRWEEYLRDLPGGRAAAPQEVADLFVWLASPRAAYVSGTIVTIDGGSTSRRRAV